MNGNQLTTLLLTLTAAYYLQLVQPCLYKVRKRPAKELILEGPWNDAPPSTRVIDDRCECGKEDNLNHSSQWILSIQAKGSFGPNSSSKVICLGTIITSNFVATSHDCLRKGRHLNVYDAFNISSDNKNILRKEDIVLDNGKGEQFLVDEIIPNPHYLYHSVSQHNLDLDLLLLKVKADFTTHKYARPICIPEDSDDIDLVGQMGHYVGINDIYDGSVFTTRMCDNDFYDIVSQREKDDKWSPLCLRWWAIDISLSQAPRTHGGPLVLVSRSVGPRAFLVGIACNKRTRLSGTGADFVYFTNILPMLKYVEYHALRHKSKWCKASKLKLLEVQATSYLNTHVWEMASVQKVIKNRDEDETLDCVCGAPNSDPGRIIGPTRIQIPYEFGWMVILILFHFGRQGGSHLCGGTIINDRMILTAAHCMIHDKKLANKTLSVSQLKTKPGDIDLKLESHNLYNDPRGFTAEVEYVLVHPAYLPARKQGYFDYDIAILVLKTPLQFKQFPVSGIRPICLAKMGEKTKTVGENATIAGWGFTKLDSEVPSDELKALDLPIIDIKECKDATKAKVTDRFLCAGTLSKHATAARGDSGGPLKIYREGQYTEVGIVSWKGSTKTPTSDKTAALYTDITHPEIIPFVDYFAKRTSARWCKSKMPEAYREEMNNYGS